MPWFETLTDSLTALGAAAREARLAAHAARTTCALYDLDRLKPIDATVTSANRPYDNEIRPHDRVLFRLITAHHEHADKLSGIYGMAALTYADGATWAITQVIAGNQPTAVHGLHNTDGAFVIPGPLPEVTGLDRWNGWKAFRAARKAMDECEYAAAFADGLASESYLSDHDAGQMHDAINRASGLSEAAFAYGQHAETALRFALLDAFRTR
ncbi:hypothetical protein ACFVUH_18245 [Kitasatospora sp. NPDC058032]|uniref:hypothetical protein n=1 Tax=Kitasatospora sp. NPDC058032 TaxID=3346307 RepID=UPI0036D8D41A